MDDADQGSARGEDWAARATEHVERFVELLRDHSVRPVLFAVKAVVVGIVALLVGVFVIVAGAIGIVRLLTEDAFSGRVWASDLVVGGIFAGTGTFLLTRGRSRRSGDDR